MQTDFEEDDPLVGQIQSFLDGYNDDYVCCLIIAREVLHNDDPDTKTTRNIGNIMNHKIAGWKKAVTHTFEGIGRQKCYVRVPVFMDCNEIPFQ